MASAAMVVVVAVGVLILATGVALTTLQVAPGEGSIKLFERTGGTATGVLPANDAQWSASQRAANTGASLRLFSSAPAGTQSWTVTYVLTCAGVHKGSGSATIGSWYDGTRSPLWFTIPNSISRPAIEVGDLCWVRVTASSSGLSWRTGTTGGFPNDRHDLVVWGEPLEAEDEPTQPPTDGTPPTIEPTEEAEPPPGDGALPLPCGLILIAAGFLLILLIAVWRVGRG